MTAIDEIQNALSKGDIKKFERQFNRVLAGNWSPVGAGEDLDALFDRLSQGLLESCPFYLSVPFSLAGHFAAKEGKGIVTGTPVSFSISEGSFLEQIGLKVIEGSLSRFVILDATERKNLVGLTLGHIKTQVRKCAEGGLFVFLILGESVKEFMEGLAFEVLKEQIAGTLEDLPEDLLTQVAVIYSPSWISAEGLSKISKNAENAYHAARHTLEEVLGNEKAGKVRVLLSMPFINGDCIKYIEKCSFDGFYFPHLGIHSEGFFKTLKSIQEKFSDQLEKEFLVKELPKIS
jgi:triosephosphate isomerase